VLTANKCTDNKIVHITHCMSQLIHCKMCQIRRQKHRNSNYFRLSVTTQLMNAAESTANLINLHGCVSNALPNATHINTNKLRTTTSHINLPPILTNSSTSQFYQRL